ncbi:hypothetical protein HKX48_000486 [Thoreauomyces humboldtii]|nr:hypothetical protein HKX48_000486 [Thoreauomyces humboldtii]
MVHQRILELVQQWNSTLCVTSRYKDDFRHINDMFRLLSYKGYRVPPLSKEEAAVLNATQSFQTEDELEEEDKIAQGAKLQELLRVGTPAALERANDLMKIMSGYDTDRIPNYKKQVEQEINRIEQRAILLNDILIQKQPDERYRPDSTMEELLGSTKSAQARIQKLISENDEDDRMGRLLELNDLINTVLSKYTDFKAGRAVQGAVARAPPVLPAKDAPTPQKPVISLIDLDDWGAPGPGVSSGPSTTSPAIVAPTPVKPQNGGLGSLMDDLGDLNFSTPPQQQPNPSFGGSGFAGLSFAPPQASTPPFGFQQQRPPAQQQQQQQSAFNAGQQGTPQGNFSQAFGSSLPGTPPIQQQSQAFGVQQNQQQLRQQPAASTPPIQQQQQQQQRPDPFGGGDLFGKLAGLNQGFSSSSAPATPPPMSVPGTPPPGASLSSQKEVMLHDKNGLQIKYRLLWKGNAWSAQAVFINVTPVPFTNLAFQVATPKSMTLHMETASGNVIPPLNQSQVIQGMHIVNPAKEPLRIRYKVQYAVNGAMVNEQGDFNES